MNMQCRTSIDDVRTNTFHLTSPIHQAAIKTSQKELVCVKRNLLFINERRS
jgi:hypothetical protein